MITHYFKSMHGKYILYFFKITAIKIINLSYIFIICVYIFKKHIHMLYTYMYKHTLKIHTQKERGDFYLSPMFIYIIISYFKNLKSIADVEIE